jgi:hypothetical protein
MVKPELCELPILPTLVPILASFCQGFGNASMRLIYKGTNSWKA